MKRIKFFLFGATLLTFLGSCTQLTPFTGQVQQRYKLSESDLKQLQFYTSDDIVLYQASNDADISTINGELLVHSDKQVKRVVIPRGTPGQVVYVYPDKLAVCFDSDASRNLLFGSKYIDGEYRLMAYEWKGKHGELKYGDETYIAAPGSGSSHLLIKLKKLQKTSVKDNVVQGRKVNGA